MDLETRLSAKTRVFYMVMGNFLRINIGPVLVLLLRMFARDETPLEWAKHNMEDALRIGLAIKNDWQSLFLSTVWHIWKAINEQVFESINLA